MRQRKRRAKVSFKQLELPLYELKNGASVDALNISPASNSPLTELVPEFVPTNSTHPSENLTSDTGSLKAAFWLGFRGRRPPLPLVGEAPLNTKRAAHHIRRSSRWLELVRYRENSPPWRKKGGLFEYYESQLDWWQEQLADTW